MLEIIMLFILIIAVAGWWSARREVSHLYKELRFHQDIIGAACRLNKKPLDDRGQDR